MIEIWWYAEFFFFCLYYFIFNLRNQNAFVHHFTDPSCPRWFVYITCNVFWLTSSGALAVGVRFPPPPPSVLKKSSAWGFPALLIQMQFFTYWRHKHLARGRTTWSYPWKSIMRTQESPLHPASLTKQYEATDQEQVLVIALPIRLKEKDMEATYFGSVCNSMGTLLGEGYFLKKINLFFITSWFIFIFVGCTCSVYFKWVSAWL